MGYFFFLTRAGKGSRTPISTLARSCNSRYTIPAFVSLGTGPLLTRTFSQTNHSWSREVIFLWDWLESNQRPSDYESPALTPELQSLFHVDCYAASVVAAFLCRGAGLNCRHKDFQSSALPLSYLGVICYRKNRAHPGDNSSFSLIQAPCAC